MDPVDLPCLSSWELARGILGSCGVVIVKYNLIQICNHKFEALPCSHERNTGEKAGLFCPMDGFTGRTSSCHGLIGSHHESSSKKGWRFNPQSCWGCTTSSHVFMAGDVIRALVFCVTQINLHNLWYSPRIPPVTSGMVLTSLNVSLSTKEWGQNKILKGFCNNLQRVL